MKPGIRHLFQAFKYVALPGLLLALFSFVPVSLTTSLAAQVLSGPSVRHEIHHDLSRPLRDMMKNAPAPSLEREEAEPLRQIPLPPGLQQLAEDPIRQKSVASLSTPVVGLNFEGLGQGQYGYFVNHAPPDTNGAVGATQYVQWVNTSFAVFNKSTGALVAGPITGNTLWSGFGNGCETNNDGDPVVVYDKIASRWVMSQFSRATLPYLECIAVSTTSDATGAWNRYSFQYSDFDDYPKMGVWPDAYYETFNLFDGNNFVGAEACAYDRTAMLNGQSATQVCFNLGPFVGGLLPADMDGTTLPPAGSPNYMLFYGANSLNLYKFHVDFNNPANSTLTGPTVINVAAFMPLCSGGTCVPQPGTSNRLDSLADRLMHRLAYRNFGSHESLVVNHSVNVSGSGGVRWYEIQNPGGTPTLAQQGTFAPDSTYRWMGSVAMDHAGDLAVGYSQSSTSVYPSIAFAGRIATDPAGTLEPETQLVSGNGSQTGTLSRWGDYSAMTVDPVDDCTFWYTQEYINTNGTFNWNTRIASFKFPNCSGSGQFTLTVTDVGLGTVTSNDGHINCGSNCTYNYNSGDQVTLTATAASGWAFSGWSGACTGTGQCQLIMNQNVSVTATFTPLQTYTLTVSSIGGSGTVRSLDGLINCPGTCSHVYGVGFPVTLNAFPAQGWNFNGWTGACSGTGSCNLTITQNLSVGASFSNGGPVTVNVGAAPATAGVNVNTNKVFVANECGNDPVCNTNVGTMSVIDGSTFNVQTVTTNDFNPYWVAVNPITNKIYSGTCGTSDPSCYSPGTRVDASMGAH